ncbi:ATP-binding cassette domain-containing protein [Aeromicrobium tamlense]|uniref:ABC-type branched-subunit amino acid transport system ATPase component n=1 Tax=Aeromicrobium tamlense TaxID=375541 RepID=A0A8I0KGR4_9ACTN|nr:ATP-binding cassette domain-containing protein [Aeromicrobium tamlense]MBD1268610.1 ATP-binding cassette domain-containing protein [Aeromicrobium tamlense]NYI37483.1 ABC-type branched-subunit amino acid transport system ATPase component [Aeromicrobium tamlense]
MLEVRGVAKKFGGLRVLTDVSFEAESGQVTALIGPNGAGKSTLVNLVSGYLTPNAGSITLDGKDITGMAPAKVFGEGVARTFQVSGNVAELNVFECVAMSAYRTASSYRGANEIAEEELKRFDLWQYRSRALGDIPTAMVRIVDCARGMAARPKILLLDEVMAGLTPAEVDIVIEQVRACRDAGVAIVMIEHVLQAVNALADRVVVLNQGTIVATGSMAEVSQNDEVKEAYLGSAAVK